MGANDAHVTGVDCSDTDLDNSRKVATEKENQTKMGDEASQTEIVISKFIAPVILSKVGKTIIVLIFLALTGLTSYACHMVQIDFSMGDYLL